MDKNEKSESITGSSLRKIAKGAGIIFTGTIIGIAIRLLARIIIIRYISVEEYGLLSLASVIIGIFALFASFGLPSGVTRNLAYYRGKGDDRRAFGVIVSSFHIIIFTSIICSLFVFLTSDSIARFFNKDNMGWVIRILSLTIPFSVVTSLLISAFRGLGRSAEKVYFSDIFSNVLRLSLFIFVVYFALSFEYVVYVYVIVPAAVSVLFGTYILKNLSKFMETGKGYVLLRKEMFLFSAPLFFMSVTDLILNRTDVLMLGYFKTADEVGLYSATLTLSRLIPLVLGSAAFIFLPVISELYSKNLIGEIKKIFQISTKWIFSLTLPIFLLFFVFPYPTLNFLYGERYLSAAPVLMLLTIGFMIHVFFGLNGMTLLSMGETRFLMFSTMTGGALNAVLNFALIPEYSIFGAAAASAVSYVAINIINGTRLYRKSGIHPFSKNYLKSLACAVLLLVPLYLLNSFFTVGILFLSFLLIFFMVLYFFLLLLTKSLDKEDISLLLRIEKMLHINLGPIKNLLKRFM